MSSVWDTSRIVFISNRGKVSDIHVMNADGTGEVVLIHDLTDDFTNDFTNELTYHGWAIFVRPGLLTANGSRLRQMFMETARSG